MSFVIINADDFGRSNSCTDKSIACFRAHRISSVSAMVFMEDSDRSAKIAKDCGIEVGLHLNLDIPFTAKNLDSRLCQYHKSITRFLSINKYALIIYNPFLVRQFRYTFNAQYKEFIRLYGKKPSHIDGHHHLHHSTNIIIGKLFPHRSKVRRNFSFDFGEKNLFNRLYRQIVDQALSQKHSTTDFFYALPDVINRNLFGRISEISKNKTVEIMTHPIKEDEFSFLMSNRFSKTLGKLRIGTYSDLS